MNIEIEIEAAIAARREEFWAEVEEDDGERTNARFAQLEQILQEVRDMYA